MIKTQFSLKNIQTKRLNLLFKRSDGNIGWLVQRSKMKLHEFISLNSIFVGVDVDSKKNVFKTVANFSKKNPELSEKLLKT